MWVGGATDVILGETVNSEMILGIPVTQIVGRSLQDMPFHQHGSLFLVIENIVVLLESQSSCSLSGISLYGPSDQVT